jgi:hypothetical protein
MDKIASRPFQFFTASYLTRIENQRAGNVGDLRAGLEACSDESIFYHTFQSLGRHHFLTEGFSNDFAQWVLAGLNRPGLAELLAGFDIRGYFSLSDLRVDLWRAVDEFCHMYPEEIGRAAFEPFYFLASVQVTAPLEQKSETLAEFRHALDHIGHGSFHFHFVASRLRLHLQSNDFSVWFSEALGLERLAKLTNQIDITTNTIDGAKARLMALVDRELAA